MTVSSGFRHARLCKGWAGFHQFLRGLSGSLAEHFNPCETLRSLVEPLWDACGILAVFFVKPQGPGPSHSPRRTSWKPETLVEPYLKPPRTTRWNPAGSTTGTLVETWWNAGGTLVEPGRWILPPAALAEAGGALVEPWWNLVELLPQPRTTPQPSQNLVEPWWNRAGTLVETYLQPPGPPRSPGGTLVKPGGTLVQPYLNHGTLVEPWWSPRRTLPQTTPDHHPSPRRILWNWWNPHRILVEPHLGGRPGPPRSLSGLRTQSFQLLGEKKKNNMAQGLLSGFLFQNHKQGVPSQKIRSHELAELI